MTHNAERSRRAVMLGIGSLACIAVGVGVASALEQPTLVNDRSLGYSALVTSVVASLAAFHWTRRSARRAAGPGLLLAAAALAGAALLGLLHGGVGTASVGPETAPYFGL